MDEKLLAFVIGSMVGTMISQIWRWQDLNRIREYINENNRLLMSNMDIVEENQMLLEALAKAQGIDWK